MTGSDGTTVESLDVDGTEHSEADDEITVLLVDDDETWLDSTAQILEHQRAAFAVTTVSTLVKARTAVGERDPDCVVSDYQLAEGAGLDLLETVRECDPELPFVLITGQGDETVASDATGRRVTDYIPKRSLGGRTDRLARRVETAVGSYRTRQALARERRSKDAMLDILTESSSRRGLAGAFCDHLVAERGYDCAWVGTIDESGGVVPAAVAGAERYVDRAVSLSAVGERLPGGGHIEVLTAVALDERLRYIVRVTGASADAFRESVDAVDAVHDSTVTDTDPLRAEVVVSLPTPETVLAGHGGRVPNTTVDG